MVQLTIVTRNILTKYYMHKMALYKHGHYSYLLKLTASLALVKKRRCILLYSCKSFVLYLMRFIFAYGHEVLSICHG